MTEPVITVAGFDALAPGEAADLLRACCASQAWITTVVAGRPHGDLAALTAASDDALAALTWPDVEQALAAHPRIGERPRGADREAAWSRGEQSTSTTGDARVEAELRDGNVAYEERFGHVFLICATGRTAAEILAALRERLGNDPGTEQDVVRHELRDIVRLRLAKTFAG